MEQAPINAETRMQAIKMRRAEIAADLLASKHRFILDGVQRPFSERTALEAEDAALHLEQLRLGQEAAKSKVLRRMRQNAHLLHQLLLLLEERGLWQLAVEASERSDVALAEIFKAQSAPQPGREPATQGEPS